MEDFKKISDDLSAAGQVSPEQLQQAAQSGFKSVLNLRSPAEAGVPADEQQQVESAGLDYANVPLSNTNPDSEQVNKALWAIEQLPKPVLLHCGAGLRASAIALIADAVQEGLTLDQLKAKAEQLGVDLEQPHLKQYIQDHYGKADD